MISKINYKKNIVGFLTKKARFKFSRYGKVIVQNLYEKYRLSEYCSVEAAINQMVEGARPSDGTDVINKIKQKKIKDFIFEYTEQETKEAYEEGARWVVESGLVEEFEVTSRAFQLFSNMQDFFVCTLFDGSVETAHTIELSSIIHHCQNMKDYGYTKIERCWNHEYLFNEDDFVKKVL